MRICSLIALVIVAGIIAIFTQSASADGSRYEGWLDVVASDGYSWVYLQTPDRTHGFKMAYTAEVSRVFSQPRNQIYVSADINDATYPIKELVSPVIPEGAAGYRSASVPRPLFMLIRDIWIEFNRDTSHGSVPSPQSRWVKVAGRLDKLSEPGKVYIVEGNKKIWVDGYFDEASIDNNKPVIATGCLDSDPDLVNHCNTPKIIVNIEEQCPLTYCYGTIRSVQ